MAIADLTKSTVGVTNISSLSSTPNATEGLTATQLQALFDKSPLDNKTYLNSTLTAEIDSAIDTLEAADTALGVRATALEAEASGWTAATGTWTYASANTINVPSGAASIYSVGDKIKLTQTTAKYFIITVVADTLLTVYGGTDYTVANDTITSPYYSKARTPLGFPVDPLKWTITVSDANNYFTTPTNATWWNPGSISIAIPIGSWKISYKVVARAAASGASTILAYLTTLSTTNNSETLTNFTSYMGTDISATGQVIYGNKYISNIYTTTTAKTLYLLSETITSNLMGNTNGFNGASVPTVITATCAYL